MVDQNQSGVQMGGQPVMGGNPYDLIDNKNQNLDNSAVQAPVQNGQTQQVNPAVQQTVQNQGVVQVQTSVVNNPEQSGVVQTGNSNMVNNNTVQQAGAKDVEPSGFTRKLIKFIAKLAGQPDPESGVNSTSVDANIQLGGQVVQNNQTVSQQQNQTAQGVGVKSSFDAVMGGVTGFLDKVEKKVEDVSGINMDATINNVMGNQNNQQEQVNTEVSQTVQEQTPVTQQVAPVQVATPQIIESQQAPVSVSTEVNNTAVDKNPDAKDQNVENSAVSKINNTDSGITSQIQKDSTQVAKVQSMDASSVSQAQVQTTVDAVKAEIDNVENNNNVPVNPVSQAQNIQFGESKPE